MQIASISSKTGTSKEGKPYVKNDVEFSDGEHAGKKVTFFGPFPFQIGDNISANIKASGQYWNGYDAKLVKKAAPDPLGPLPQTTVLSAQQCDAMIAKEQARIAQAVANTPPPIAKPTGPLPTYYDKTREQLIDLLEKEQNGPIHGHIENTIMTRETNAILMGGVNEMKKCTNEVIILTETLIKKFDALMERFDRVFIILEQPKKGDEKKGGK